MFINASAETKRVKKGSLTQVIFFLYFCFGFKSASLCMYGVGTRENRYIPRDLRLPEQTQPCINELRYDSGFYSFFSSRDFVFAKISPPQMKELLSFMKREGKILFRFQRFFFLKNHKAVDFFKRLQSGDLGIKLNHSVEKYN